jgi:hypothetical protein
VPVFAPDTAHNRFTVADSDTVRVVELTSNERPTCPITLTSPQLPVRAGHRTQLDADARAYRTAVLYTSPPLVSPLV